MRRTRSPGYPEYIRPAQYEAAAAPKAEHRSPSSLWLREGNISEAAPSHLFQPEKL